MKIKRLESITDKDLSLLLYLLNSSQYVINYSKKELITYFKKEKYGVYVLLESKEVVGYAAYEIFLTSGLISFIIIKPEYRGKGYGFQFYKFILDKLLDQDINQIFTSSRNATTQKWLTDSEFDQKSFLDLNKTIYLHTIKSKLKIYKILSTFKKGLSGWRVYVRDVKDR
jgi:N-acetylglutamate synthase-like GNAT family acetyltransferase